jgi:N-acetylmuramoyl-L-alanine amidase
LDIGGLKMHKLYLSHSNQFDNIGVDGHTEAEYMIRLAQEIVNYLKPYPINIRVNASNMALMEIVNDSNRWRPDFHLALHSNAMPKLGSASGVEAWIHKVSKNGDRMADLIIPELSRILRLKIRGGKEDPDTKETTIDSPGHLAEVDRTVAPACILEIYFHDNANDNRAYLACEDLIVKAIGNGILKYFGVTQC